MRGSIIAVIPDSVPDRPSIPETGTDMTTTSEADINATLIRLIKDIKIAMLTTVDETGRLQSRPMLTQAREFDGVLWFLVAKDSRPALDIARNQAVNLSYSSPEHQRHVSIVGRAELVDDRTLIEAWWSSAYLTWFPLGIDDPALVLIKVTVELAEYWESTDSWAGWVLAFSKSLLTGEPIVQDQHQRVARIDSDSLPSQHSTHA